MILYRVEKQGVYNHGVFGIYDSFHEAVAVCNELADSDEDNYHTWYVYSSNLNERVENEEEIYETKQGIRITK